MPEMWDDLYIEDNRSFWDRVKHYLRDGTRFNDNYEIMNDGSLKQI